jgi:vesicular inhibitory amino acid transporter
MSTLKQQDYLPLKQDDTIHDVDQSKCQQEDTNTKLSLDDETTNKDLPLKKGQQCSVWKTTLNLLNYMEGVGFLALPYAVYRGGIAAVIGFFFAPLVLGYTASLLVECLYDINEDGEKIRVRSSYQEIGLHCWAPLKTVTSVIISLSTLITAVSYVVLVSSLMSQIFPGIPLTESQWSCVATLVVLPAVFLKQLSQIAWLSILALFALLGSVCLSLTYEFQEVHKWDVQSVMFWDTEGVVIAFNIIVFSYTLHSVVVTAEGEMVDKSKFNVALVTCYCIGAVIKVTFAVAGFLTYTLATKEVILNNLPAGIPTMLIATLFSLSVLLTFPIPTLVVVRILEESWAYDKMTEKIHPKLCFASLRIGVVLLILALAVVTPHFAFVSSLDGCLDYVFGIFFPGLFHVCIKYKQLTRFQVLVDILLMIFGIVGMSYGFVETVQALVQIW